MYNERDIRAMPGTA